MTSDRIIDLPSDPAEALNALREASQARDVVVFKKSPICPVSHRAEFEFRAWIKDLDQDANVGIAEIDVIAEKPLARGLTAELDIEHESPQALWFSKGELSAHDSHSSLTKARFQEGVTP